MELTFEGLKQVDKWNSSNIIIPKYDIQNIISETKKSPEWIHFGSGNIFRIFIGGIADKLIEKCEMKKGIVCVETFDFDIIDKIYKPYDNLVLAVTLKSNGTTHKQVYASLTEALKANSSNESEWNRLKEIFKNPKLQIASFTITEKGYSLKTPDNEYFPFIKSDIENGPENPKSVIAIVCSLLNERYKENKSPLALVSMDNCSHNGEKLKNSVIAIAKEWVAKGYIEEEFIKYLNDKSKISFPWTMIDKITPRPAEIVQKELEKIGIEDIGAIVTSKNTYIAPFVNAEEPQYLVIEDEFPNGRPALEKAGVYMTDRETVNKVEKMKVTACLNPLHTALAVYGCILGYKLIADEMKDSELNKLVRGISFVESMPVVINPEIISPEEFTNEVLDKRMSNPFMPDTPQRIATDTSQKVGIRYGETIKAYVQKFGDAKKLKFIPLAIAGWCRYLLGVDDKGEKFELSPDPLISELTNQLKGIEIGKPETYNSQLKPILSNVNIFGIDLYKAGIAEIIESFFIEEISKVGAVRETLKKYLN